MAAVSSTNGCSGVHRHHYHAVSLLCSCLSSRAILPLGEEQGWVRLTSGAQTQPELQQLLALLASGSSCGSGCSSQSTPCLPAHRVTPTDRLL